MANLGRVAYVNRGAYNADSLYEKYDVVYDADTNSSYTYINEVATQGNVISNPEYWNVMVNGMSLINGTATILNNANTAINNVTALANETIVEKAFITPRGAHQLATLYNFLDCVTSNGSTYVYVNQESTIGNSLNDSLYWMMLAQKGDGSGVDGLLVEDGKLYLTDNGVKISNGVTMPSGGGGGTSGSVTLTNLLPSNLITAAQGSEIYISFIYTSSEDDGPGTSILYVNEVSKATNILLQGVSNNFEISQYLGNNVNTVRVYCSDIYGNYKSISYTITVIDLRILSPFDDSVIHIVKDETGFHPLVFKYTPYGAVEKFIHFFLDDVEIATDIVTTTGKQITKNIDSNVHGTHKLEVYATSEVGISSLRSKSLLYDVMCVDIDNTAPMISSIYDVTETLQGSLLNIPFTIYDPLHLLADVTLTMVANAETYFTQERSVGRLRQFWSTRDYPAGEVFFTIAYGALSRTHVITVTENIVPVEAVTNDLFLHLTSNGRSNTQQNKDVWSYDSVSTVFEDINWIDTGWVVDANGDTALHLASSSKATIGYKPFATDARTYGRTLEFEFAIRDVNNRDAIAISCMNNGVGLQLTADTATFVSELSKVECKYTDEEKNRVSFVVEALNEDRLLSVYLNGVISGVIQYPSGDNFQQLVPQNIVLGSPYCSVDIYNIRVYNTALTKEGIRNNFIADTADPIVKAALYAENNALYDIYGGLSFEEVKKFIPVMVFTGPLPQFKGDKQKVVVAYTDPKNPSLNFEQSDVTIDVQGTSSQYYVRKNYKISKMSVPVQHAPNHPASNVFTVKADYAESTGTHNTQIANIAHDWYQSLNLQTPPQVAYPELDLRTTVYGFPIVIYHKADGASSPVFIGKYNFNYDKGSLTVYGFTSEFANAESWEFLNNVTPPCVFQGELTVENQALSFEARQPDGFTDITAFKVMHDWTTSTYQDGATGNALAEPYTDVHSVVHTVDNAAYRLAKFETEFEDHFDFGYCCMYYITTLILQMTDQRAKNMFLTTWDKIHWQPWFYDNDTAIGINNEGYLKFDYYHEDIDQLESANVFNGQNSTLWVNFRQSFATQIQTMYLALRDNGSLDYENLLSYFIENGSDKWSVSIYNEDADYKYIDMARTDNDTSNLYQARGTGEEHLRYFLSNRIKYFDTKWYGEHLLNSYISLRIYTPSTWYVIPPNADITVIPYSNMYAAVRYGANSPFIQQRAEKNVPVTFDAPPGSFNDLETGIYGASEISSLGSLAALYCGTINVSMATKLRELIIGNPAPTYVNSNLVELSVGTNDLLKIIDLRGCVNLATPIDLSNCPNVEEVYADRTSITGVSLPNSGYLNTLTLPNTITNLTLKNQIFLQNFECAGYENLNTLWIENTPGIPLSTILDQATGLARVRLIDCNIAVDNVDALELLSNIGGLDEGGNNVARSVMTGTITVGGTIYSDQYAVYALMWPELNIVYSELTVRFIVNFRNWDNTLLKTEKVLANGTAIAPMTNPTRNPTTQYVYTFSGWNVPLTNINANMNIIAMYTSAPRPYTMSWTVEGVVVTTTTTAYGFYASYPYDTMGIPYKDSPEGTLWKFSGWSPDMNTTLITGNQTFTAQFIDWLDPNSVITEVGDYAFYYDSNATFTSLPATVTKIGKHAFEGCSALSLTSLPNAVTYIGEYAFKDCTNMASTNLPASLAGEIGQYAFKNCPKLAATGAMSNAVTSIGQYAFHGCTMLALSSLSSAITSIGTYAFYDCPALVLSSLPIGITTIEPYTFYGGTNLALTTLPNGITSIGTYAFYNCVNMHLESVGTSLTTLEPYAFYGCAWITLTSLPEYVTIIPAYCFYGCTRLNLAYLPSGLLQIKEMAFVSCTALPLASLPASITLIEREAFRYCSNITLTSLPEPLNATYYAPYSSRPCIGNYTFNGCTKLALTSLPDNIKVVGAYAFGSCTNLMLASLPSNFYSISTGSFDRCTNMPLSYFPDTMIPPITASSWHAFYMCTHICMTQFPASWTSVGSGWWGCTALALTSLPAGVTSLPDNAFADCPNVVLSSLPSGITSIGVAAFKNCTGITLSSLPNGLLTIGNNAFKGCTGITFTTLPSGITNLSGASIFENCTNLALTSLPSGVTGAIGAACFKNCSNITLSAFPSGITGIGDDAFNGCSSVTFTNLPSGLLTLGLRAFQGCSSMTLSSLTWPTNIIEAKDSLFEGCTSITSISFPSTVSYVRQKCFKGCTSLVSVVWPTTWQNIPTECFMGCTSLTTITWPTAPTRIYDKAFSGCTSIAWTSLPSTITMINNEGFYNCTNLALTQAPSQLDGRTFGYCSSLPSNLQINLTTTTFIGGEAFYMCSSLVSVYMVGAIPTMTNAFWYGTLFTLCNNLTNIYVPWASGYMQHAPWGALVATINYNYIP